MKILLILVIPFSTSVHAESSEFVKYYDTNNLKVPSKQQIVAAHVSPPAEEASTTENEESHPYADKNYDGANYESEIVSAPQEVAPPEEKPEEIVIKPKLKPEDLVTKPKPQPEPEEQAPEATAEIKIRDLPNCNYKESCWKDLSLLTKIKKVVANVDYVNSKHGTKVDPRYFLCTGYRESTFNPGALGGAGERGMFQVMVSTGKAALRQGSKIPEFKNYSATDYIARMAMSSVAQTELSLLTLKMKVKEGASSRTLTGNGSLDDYQGLARRYNGAGSRAVRYSQKIRSCLSCMRDNLKDVHGSISESKAKACLNRAKD